MANKESQSVIPSKVSEARPPSEKPQGVIDRTPPRPSRRLSIENCSSLRHEKAPEERKGARTPSMRTRARRLSLEGSNQGKKDHFLVKMSEDISRVQPIEAHGHLGNDSSLMEEEVGYQKPPPGSPVSSAYKSRIVKATSRTQVAPFQLTKMPDPAREVVQIMQSEMNVAIDFRTTSFISSRNGKGSQIRKSLRTIGKLINGSEKR